VGVMLVVGGLFDSAMLINNGRSKKRITPTHHSHITPSQRSQIV
jgi:hypothetical protein